jgi:hypothetical protein
MPNGLTQKTMVERMYTELVGLDGASGLVKEHRETKDQVNRIAASMVTKPECAAIRKAKGDVKDKLLLRVKDLLLIASTIVSLLLAFGFLKRGAP